ncbi:hypothetical protein BB559_004553 [Furculomyces boomerangus]|uniref:Uncharacterized protein n=2 Tax=Harpellales TaxID=61421 RepID=A0A2T9YE49_9FUNG|nr:hypothetical protein BB559_004553 [Furculomyces boomerangus]PWA01407.1 hypothetical protein BB558_002491 [Smittium angustum]
MGLYFTKILLVVLAFGGLLSGISESIQEREVSISKAVHGIKDEGVSKQGGKSDLVFMVHSIFSKCARRTCDLKFKVEGDGGKCKLVRLKCDGCAGSKENKKCMTKLALESYKGNSSKGKYYGCIGSGSMKETKC